MFFNVSFRQIDVFLLDSVPNNINEYRRMSATSFLSNVTLCNS